MVQGELAITAAMVAGFVAIHLLVRYLRFLDVTPRSRWLSFAGGVAVAYIFLHVLPDIGMHQREFAAEMGVEPTAAESAIYSLALAGLAIFYGLERAVKTSRGESRAKGEGDRVESDVLYLHLVTYGTFNALVGYLLLHREESGAWALALYFGAMGLHFLTADFGMRQDHREAYDKMGRWVISAAVIAGWIIGATVELSPVAIGCLFAFLAGGIILNVLKEELPEERQSYFLPFLFGVLLYAGLIMAERHWA
ncbi:hypothetical protein [Aurantiacibacter poecillastricola]|uniref:hypothetical protein n=1 Tax=Aurantiacibacter poecillastricola TaxID=3064385 RepID=UPI00273D9800|nr:hypothetical protein [Aurantiacibacter sp. 219JJ12-13]MDP5262942.1 hypothetical protein [Aurantiacibacter sp. 219JJ12-13]